MSSYIHPKSKHSNGTGGNASDKVETRELKTLKQKPRNPNACSSRKEHDHEGIERVYFIIENPKYQNVYKYYSCNY
jgi:hypothetical protein